MTIGIDISQLAYPIKTGVYNYLYNLVAKLLEDDKKNNYVLFFSSLRRSLPSAVEAKFKNSKNVEIKKYKFPPTFLDILWNIAHSFSINRLIGYTDVFLTSDWTEPPVSTGRKATIIYDLTVYKVPKEMDRKIIKTQRRKLKWVKKESSMIICISESTKRDVREILGIEKERLNVIYPGL